MSMSLIFNLVLLVALIGVAALQFMIILAFRKSRALKERELNDTEELIALLRVLDGARFQYEKDDGQEGVIRFGSDGEKTH